MPSSPPPPTRAAHARLEADLAAARLRVERSVVDQACAGPSDAAEAAARVLAAEADVAELEDRLGTRAAPYPMAAAANDTAPAAPALPLPAFLDTREAAALLGVSVKTLEALRARDAGPPFKRVGRRVRYEHALLIEWARQK